MKKVSNQIDLNDLMFVQERHGLAVSSSPCPQNKLTGKIDPHVSQFKILGAKEGQTVSVFHVKPVYYEHASSTDEEMVWRPMYEVTSHYGNHLVIFEYEKLLDVHPRFMEWLKKRMKLINGQILITSPFSPVPTPYSFIHETVHNTIVRPRVGLTTTTVYPDPDPETTTVDGVADYDGSASSWATIQGATDGGAASSSGTTLQCYVAHQLSPSLYYLYRAFLLFDTSAIADADTINSATFSWYATTKIDDALSLEAGNRHIRLVQSTPASNTNIVVGDYDQGGTTGGASDIAVASFTTSAYNDFALNATGLGWISKTGVTKLGLRHTADINNEAPVSPAGDDYSLIYGYSADQTGTTTDPKLVVIHSSSVSITVTPSTQATTFSIPTYTPKINTSSAITTLTALFSIPVYTIISGSMTYAASVVSATFSVVSYTAKASANVVVNTLSATFSAITYAIGLGSRILQATLSATFTTAVLAKVGAVWTKVARNASGVWTRSNRNND